jgi:CD63 antigen
MSIIFLSELILGLVGIFEHGNLPEVLDSHLSKLQDEYTLRGEAKDAWELVQSELSCCGINGASEWEIVFRNGSISSSCCDLLPINEEFCTVERAAKIGCLYRLERILGTKSLLLAWASFGAAVIQVIFL